MSASKKFRYTRELIKLALDDEMTQEGIAKLCRVGQSTVSKWKNGKSRAPEHVVAPLLKRYGHRLQRATKRVYMLGEEPLSMTVVEGPIVFRCSLMRPHPRGVRKSREGVFVGGVVHEATRRWLVHQTPGPAFVLVRQERRHLSDLVFKKQCERLGLEREIAQIVHRPWVQSRDDAARWTSEVDPPRTLVDLLRFADQYREYDNAKEGQTVRFLLRKSLLEHGHAIPELEQARQND